MQLSEAVQRAIYATLKASSALSNAFAGPPRVYDDVPKNPAFPYITIGDDQITDDGSDGECVDAQEIFSTIHVWSRELGKIECKRINDAVRMALTADFAVEGFALTLAQFRDSRVLQDPDGITKHGIVTFRFLIDAA